MSDWIPLKAKWDSKCITCEQPTNTGFDILWKKGVGVIHPDCNKPDEIKERDLVAICHECKKKLIECDEYDCQICHYSKSFCTICDTHSPVAEMK